METIKLDLVPGKKMPSLHASQYDDGREHGIDLFENGVVYKLDGTETLTINERKGDNCICSLDIENTFADSNHIVFASTEQMCAVWGNNICELVIAKGDVSIGTLNFILEIEPSPTENGIESESEIKNLERQITDIANEVVPEIIGEDYYNKEQTDELLDNKANKDETYTKEEVDENVSDAIYDVLPSKKTTLGSIAYFETDLALPIVELTADVTAVQEAGTPTPSTPKAISGWNAITLDVNGNVEVINLGGTYYGGHFTQDKAGHRQFEVTHKFSDLGDFNYISGSYSGISYFRTTVSDSSKNNFSYISDIYKSASNVIGVAGLTDNYTFFIYTNANMYIRNDEYSTPSAFKTAMAGKKLVYELATPYTIDLPDGTPVNTIIGTNNISVDTGDIAVEYKVKPTDDKDTNTWRAIKVEGVEKLGNGINSGAVDVVGSANIDVTFDANGNKIKLATKNLYNKTEVDLAFSETNEKIQSIEEQLPTKQTSGAFAVVDKAPMIGFSIAAPVGTTSGIVTRTGKNIYPKYATGSSSSLSWTVANDGTITFSGTPTADVLLRLQNLYIPATNNNLTVALFNNKTDARLSFFAINSNNQNNYQVNMSVLNATDTHLHEKDIVELRLRVPKNINWTGLIIKPMLIVGDSVGNFEAYTGESFNVTIDSSGNVNEEITLVDGVNTVWSNVGNVTLKTIESVQGYVDGKLDALKDSFYRYSSNNSGKYLYIYFKSGEKYIRWELHNVPAPLSNSNTWQIGQVCGLDGNLSNPTEIVRGGEFELAFKEHGAADYCGGNNHGDENTDTFILFIDGKLISDITALDNNYHEFNRIDAYEIATVNRCDTPTDLIIKHKKIWTFENGKVKVKQTFKFLETVQVDGMLVCMLPALRSAFDYGIRQGTVAIEDMTATGFPHISTVSDDVFYLMYGDNATAKVSAKTDNPNEASCLWINDASDLNKLYYGYFGMTNSSSPVTVAQDTIAQSEAEYDIAYS